MPDHGEKLGFGLAQTDFVGREVDLEGNVDERERDEGFRELLDRATTEGRVTANDQAEIMILFFSPSASMMEGKAGWAQARTFS